MNPNAIYSSTNKAYSVLVEIVVEVVLKHPKGGGSPRSGSSGFYAHTGISKCSIDTSSRQQAGIFVRIKPAKCLAASNAGGLERGNEAP